MVPCVIESCCQISSLLKKCKMIEFPQVISKLHKELLNIDCWAMLQGVPEAACFNHNQVSRCFHVSIELNSDPTKKDLTFSVQINKKRKKRQCCRKKKFKSLPIYRFVSKIKIFGISSFFSSA